MVKLILTVGALVLLGFGLRYGATFLEDSSDTIVKEVQETCNLFNSRNVQVAEEHDLDIGSELADCEPDAADVEGRAEQIKSARCDADIGFDC